MKPIAPKLIDADELFERITRASERSDGVYLNRDDVFTLANDEYIQTMVKLTRARRDQAERLARFALCKHDVLAKNCPECTHQKIE